MLAAEGCRQVIVTGRSVARVQETAAQLAAETKTQVFTPLELDLDAPTSVQSALAELVRLGRPIDFLLLNAGWIGGKSACSLRRASRRLRPRSSAISNRLSGCSAPTCSAPPRGLLAPARNLPEGTYPCSPTPTWRRLLP